MIWWSTVILLLANLGPLYGVLFLDWSISLLLFIYWSESGIMAFFNILKMAMSRGTLQKKLFLVPFFCVHFGLFMLGHFMILVGEIFPQDRQVVGPFLDQPGLFNQIKWAYLILFLSHAFSFLVNFVRQKEYRRLTVSAAMLSIYGRIFFMHVVVLFASFLTLFLDSEGKWNAALITLFAVFLKTVADLASHFRSHFKLQHA